MNSPCAREAVVLLAHYWPYLFWAGIVALIGFELSPVWSQTVLDPRPLAAVCAYNSSPPTATAGTFIYVQCDSTGKLSVH